MSHQHLVETFAHHLYHFTKTIDVLNARQFDAVFETTSQYLSKAFDVPYWEVVVPAKMTSGELGLRTEKSTLSARENPYGAIKTPDGKYYGQTSFAFEKGYNLWVIHRDGKPLKEHGNGSYRNLLDEAKSTEIPPFVPVHRWETRSSIMFFFPEQNTLINFESTTTLPKTDEFLSEFEMIAKSIVRLNCLQKACEPQRKGTDDSIGLLKAKSEDPFAAPRIPMVFFASPEKGDPAVVKAVREALDGHGVRYFHWESNAENRPISETIWERMPHCTIGIAYVSEFYAGGGKHLDNANVMFEAGMMEALCASKKHSMRAWIPIREEPPPNAPFNIHGAHILMVPRDPDRSLNREKFIEALCERLREAKLFCKKG